MVLLHCQVAYTYVFEFRPQKQEREGESLVLFQIWDLILGYFFDIILWKRVKYILMA